MPVSGRKRILAVDDHPFLRQSVISLLGHEPDLVCCGQGETVAGTPALVASTSPDLLLLDIRLADGESYDLIFDSSRGTFPGADPRAYPSMPSFLRSSGRWKPAPAATWSNRIPPTRWSRPSAPSWTGACTSPPSTSRCRSKAVSGPGDGWPRLEVEEGPLDGLILSGRGGRP